MTEQEEITSSCSREVLDWILGNISSLRGLLSTRTGCTGYLKDMWIQHLGTQFSGGLLLLGL